MTVNEMRVGEYAKTRAKLSDDDKEIIKQLYTDGMTISAIARQYEVSRTLIKGVVDPAYRERNKAYLKEHAAKYRNNYNEIMQRHRDYKRQLFKEGKI